MTQTSTPANAAAASSGADDYPTFDVAPLQQVLAALSDPVRLEMVRRLVGLEPVACSALYDEISKSTASHHFKTLREAGVTERLVVGGRSCQRLRLAEVENAYPGVLSAILTAAGA